MAKHFGDKLRQIRHEKGIGQEEIRKALGYKTNSYISDAERGKFIPQGEKLYKWGAVLGLSPEKMDDLLLEYKLEELGLDDPGFTLMFKEVPNMTREEKASLIRSFEDVIHSRHPRKKRS
ncbi:MAG: helix-turn-helix transcriptional regulator [Acidithiobacillus ferrivorans]